MTLTALSPEPRVAGNFTREQATDAILLRRFIHRHDEEAFAEIVRKHGPMVLRTAQRMLGRDADDVFQAAFMVLVRRATAIQPPEMLGPWLHGVACRCALQVRKQRARQVQREQPLTEAQPVMTEPVESQDWLPYLDQEIQKLPEHYRRPIVLCELEGRSRREVAELLGIAEGTLSSRLATARQRLARRLGHRGLLSVTILGSWLALESSASASLPESLVESTTRIGMHLLEHSATALSPAVATLSDGAMKSMFYSKCKLVALVAVSISCLGYGCWFLGDVGAAEPGELALMQDDQKPTRSGQGSANTKRGSVNTTNRGAQAGQNSTAIANSRPGQNTINTTSASANDQKPAQSSNGSRNDSKNSVTITGSGKITTETRDVSDYREIVLLNAGSITLKQTGKESLTLTTDDNLHEHLLTVVDDGRLTLKNAKEKVQLRPSKKIDYVIEVKDLNAITIDGSGSVAASEIECKSLKIGIAGSGSVSLSGTANIVNLTVNGSGSVQAADLEAKQASINIPGSASVVVNASESLNVKISGSASVKYVGEPKITKTIHGTGVINKYVPKP